MHESVKKVLLAKAKLLRFTVDFQFVVFVLYNHRLYSAYFIFFAPCLLRVLFFVYPLLLSTFLLFLVFSQPEESEFKPENAAKVEKWQTPPYENCILVSFILNLADIFKERMGEEDVKEPILEVFDLWRTDVFDFNMGTCYSEKGRERCAGAGCKSLTAVREWKRTLACKLYEEKQKKWRETLGGKLIIADDEFAITGDEFTNEGMDLLWEMHEDCAKSNEKTSLERDGGILSREESKRNLLKNYSFSKKGSMKSCRSEEEEEEEEEGVSSSFCCLSALRFSTKKISFGMGKRSLVKFSKTLKGIEIFKNVHERSKKIKSRDLHQIQY